jgi:uncharacterized membrane protein YfcA
MDISILLLTLIVLIAYITQAMTGFGSVIIAITLGSHLYPIEFLLPTIVPADLLVNIYIVGKYRQDVDRGLLFRRILPLMGAGLLIGIGLFQLVHGTLLKKTFGLFITLLCSRELYGLLQSPRTTRALSRFKYSMSVLAAGITQGLFASGGPLVVYAVSRLNLPKGSFRSTLSALWLLTNSVLTLSYIATGLLTPANLKFWAWLAPAVVVGTVIGERLHDRVNEHHFRIIVFAILLVAGISILIR